MPVCCRKLKETDTFVYALQLWNEKTIMNTTKLRKEHSPSASTEKTWRQNAINPRQSFFLRFPTNLNVFMYKLPFLFIMFYRIAAKQLQKNKSRDIEGRKLAVLVLYGSRVCYFYFLLLSRLHSIFQLSNLASYSSPASFVRPVVTKPPNFIHLIKNRQSGMASKLMIIQWFSHYSLL